MTPSAAANVDVARRLDAGRRADQAAGRAGGAGVAADLGDRQPGGQRGGLRAGNRRAFDQQPGDGLAVLVQQPVGGRRAGDRDDGQQRPRGDEAADPRRHRAVGQLAHQVRAGRLPADDRLADVGAVGTAIGTGIATGVATGVAGEQQLAASRSARVFQGQPGPVQPPVEGVEPSAPEGGGGPAGPAARLGDDVELGPEGRQHSGEALVPRLRVVSGGNETCQARGHRATPLPAM